MDSTVKYLELTSATKDSLFNQAKERAVQSLSFDKKLEEQEKQQAAEQAQAKYRNRLFYYLLLAGLLILSTVAGGLWRRNVYRKKSIAQLQRQKKEIQSTLTQLKVTQSQLIQSEKMASLGVLTAGIAHEIQNPLNFVNNFSEVNRELIEELKSEIIAGNHSGIIAIANDISENEEKINRHGKRADAIVKGMLQHSQNNAGQKEPTDLNALTDEYLRLAYHGIRSREKDFNVTIKTDFDSAIGVINIIRQDIGRVLLNLYNNAFYAVDEKNRERPEEYKPAILVSTKKMVDGVEIRVMDNGNGIPQKLLDKIFQPFFTTKPTGQGTGLGLSLSYDIVKAHGGEIKVDTGEGEYTEFIITLPT
jgi:signal transduction histidine kinase